MPPDHVATPLSKPALGLLLAAIFLAVMALFFTHYDLHRDIGDNLVAGGNMEQSPLTAGAAPGLDAGHALRGSRRAASVHPALCGGATRQARQQPQLHRRAATRSRVLPRVGTSTHRRHRARQERLEYCTRAALVRRSRGSSSLARDLRVRRIDGVAAVRGRDPGSE